MDAAERNHLLDRGHAAHEAGPMDHVPGLWTAAYAPSRPPLSRALARQLLRVRCFARRLALLDHTGGGGY
jgi:hypothetical protein